LRGREVDLELLSRDRSGGVRDSEETAGHSGRDTLRARARGFCGVLLLSEEVRSRDLCGCFSGVRVRDCEVLLLCLHPSCGLFRLFAKEDVATGYRASGGCGLERVRLELSFRSGLSCEEARSKCSLLALGESELVRALPLLEECKFSPLFIGE
jgi:hypothetical protein